MSGDFAERLRKGIETTINSPEWDNRTWHELTPDQWSPEYMERKKQAWRTKFKDYTFFQFYELLLNDEGYWHEVNNLIANLPPEPEKIHSSTAENFYRHLLPWAGVSQDWLNDSTVTKTLTVTESGNTFERPIRTVFHYNHKRPDGMGAELSVKHAQHVLAREGGRIWDRNTKLLDGVVDVVASGGKAAKGVAKILDPGPQNQNIIASTFSFTTMMLILGAVATAALWLK